MLRRVAVLLAILLVLGAALTALAPDPARDDEIRSRGTPPVTPAREDVTTAVRGTLPRDRIVRARVGDNVELTVVARGLDSATIAGLGLTDAASPGAPAQFSFRADRVGRFAVRLTLSDTRAGAIVVRPAAGSSTGAQRPMR